MTSSTRTEAERLAEAVVTPDYGHEAYEEAIDLLETALAAAEERGRQRGLNEAEIWLSEHGFRGTATQAIRSLKQPRTEEEK